MTPPDAAEDGAADVDNPGQLTDDERVNGRDEVRFVGAEPLIAVGHAAVPYAAPWWIVRGESIDATALSNRRNRREWQRSKGLPAGYDTFWGFVEIDPASVVPIVRDAQFELEWRDFELQRLRMPGLIPLLAGAVGVAAAAFGVVGGSTLDRLAAAATSLVVGVLVAPAVSRFSIPPRLATVGAAVAVTFAGVSAVPAVHVSPWYAILVGLAFAGAGVAVAALWPIWRAWRIEQVRWADPCVALVAALLEFANCVESDPAPSGRRRAVVALDRAAIKFELKWYRVNRTGVEVTDRQLRGWAGRMRAETRELQRSFAFAAPSTLNLLLRTYELIQAIVNRWSLDDHEDAWVRHGSWRRPPTSVLARLWARSKVSGRYLRQCLLAGLIAIVALVLLVSTVWAVVSTYIGSHVSPGLGSVLNFDPAVRVFVATISLSLLAAAGRVFARRH